MKKGTARDLEDMASDTEKASAMLSTARVNLVLYACTTGSLIGGKKWQEDLERRMRASVSVPVITTAGAVVDALREMKLEKIAVGTPYAEELNSAEMSFFEENGFEVTKLEGLGHVNGEDLHAETPEATVALAKRVDTGNADGVFLSCTDLKTLTVLEQLERDLGKPVLSSNSASLWKCLKVLGGGRDLSVKGCGSLLERF